MKSYWLKIVGLVRAKNRAVYKGGSCTALSGTLLQSVAGGERKERRRRERKGGGGGGERRAAEGGGEVGVKDRNSLVIQPLQPLTNFISPRVSAEAVLSLK